MLCGLGILVPHVILFFDLFPEPIQKSSKLKVRGLYILGFLIFSLAFLPENPLTQGLFLDHTWPEWIGFGSMIFSLGLVCRALTLKLHYTTNLIYKFRVRVLLISGIITLALFLSEIIFGIIPTGSIALTVFFYLIFQALLHHRLLDLKEVLGRGLLAIVLTTIFSIFLWTLSTAEKTGPSQFFEQLLFVGILVILFDPLKRSFLAVGRHLFFARHADFQEHLQTLRESISTQNNPQEVFDHLGEELCQSGRLTSLSIYTADPEKQHLRLTMQYGESQRIPHLIIEKDFYNWISRHDQPIILESGSLLTLTKKKSRLEPLHNVSPNMAGILSKKIWGQLQAQGMIPLATYQGDFLGLLNLTFTDPEDSFSTTELRLLKTLSRQIATLVFHFENTEQRVEKDRLAGLGEMAAGLAHEIRNPLGAIRGAAQILLQNPNTTSSESNGAHFLKIILEESDRLNRVLEHFLSYARTDTSTSSDTRVNLLLEKTIDLMRAEHIPENIKINLNFDKSLPAIAIQQDKMKQVFLNLLQNAIQAMPKGGDLKISTQFIQNQDNNGEPSEIEIRFEDSGSGMNEQSLKQIFAPFFTTKEKGLGLGLTISQRIVKEHGGTLWAKSPGLGKGSTFGICLALNATETSK